MADAEKLNILTISKTAGFRHESIPNAIKAFSEMAQENNWSITFTEDSAYFNDNILDKVDVVVFLMTTQTIFNEAEKAAFQRYFRNGGRLLAVHSGGTDTEYEWPWYRELIGAEFIGHPPVCEVELIIEDCEHPSTRHFECDRIKWEDEIYSFDQNPREFVDVLISVDEESYDVDHNPWFPGVNLRMGDHPLTWVREFEGGKLFHTALGHTKEIYDHPDFRKHLSGAVEWLASEESLANNHQDNACQYAQHKREFVEEIALAKQHVTHTETD